MREITQMKQCLAKLRALNHLEIGQKLSNKYDQAILSQNQHYWPSTAKVLAIPQALHRTHSTSNRR